MSFESLHFFEGLWGDFVWGRKVTLVVVTLDSWRLLVTVNRSLNGLLSTIPFLCVMVSLVIGGLWVVNLQLMRFAANIGSISVVQKRLCMVRLEGVISTTILSLLVGAIGVMFVGSTVGLSGGLLLW